MSTPQTNKQIVTRIMNALAEGDRRPFAEAMAEDFTWHITGTSAWSGSYRGRQSVREDLMAPLFAQFATRYTNRPLRILADGDFVAVECRGDTMAASGRPYCNEYCYVIRMEGGLMRELTEYLDTRLVDTALAPPPHAAPA